MFGMDVAAVRDSMKRIDQFAGQLENTTGQITAEMNRLLSIWQGPDAATYVDGWDAHRNSLMSLVSTLHMLAAVGQKQATEQEAASQS